MIDIYLDYKKGLLKNKLGIKDQELFNKAQADFSSLRTRELLEDKNASISIEYYRYIHYHMFQDLFDWAGAYRTINIEKYEMPLGGLSVKYADYNDIDATMNALFDEIRNTDISSLTENHKLEYIADIMVKLWACHPFRDGNTRTVIIFVCNYCKKVGIDIDQTLLINNCAYVRNSLVAAAFRDDELEVIPNKSYLHRIMRDMMGIEEKEKTR